MSPQNEVVMSSARLHMTFPARAILIPTEVFLKPSFLSEFCNFLKKLNAMTVNAMLPHTRKAGTSVAEYRDSANPYLVTQFLMAVLSTEGSHLQMQPISKNIRDSICYESSLLPWRRCSLWLVIRVSLQLTFTRAQQPETGWLWYKDFMCHVFSNFLETALSRGSSSETLHFIKLKLGRRVAKLGSRIGTATVTKMKDRLERSQLLLQERWRSVQKQHQLPLGLTPDDGDGDTQLELSSSWQYIRSRIQKAKSLVSSGPIDSLNLQSWTRVDLHPNVLPDWSIFGQACTPQPYALFDFESWVAGCLRSWSESARPDASTCIDLYHLVRSYYQAGKECYRGDAKQLSIMYLTIFDIWCVLDQVAINACPMIRQTSPEIPVAILEPLLLSDKESFTRLARIEHYIKSRKGDVSVFGPIRANSFSVRYFDTSNELKALKIDVENEAHREVSLKRDEWQRLSAEHSSLLSQAAALAHDHDTYGMICSKCDIESKAERLSIRKYEWPLPTSVNHAKATVFELRCPSAFQVWREIVWMLLYDLRPRHSEGRHSVEETLLTYDSLRRYQGHFGERFRLTLASKTKSFMKSHYDTGRFPCEFRDVSLPNALQFELFDQTGSVMTADVAGAPNIKADCTLRVDTTPYSMLQWTLESSSHSENQVIAAQDSCPPDLSLHEFHAFGTLRSGERLQWVNILRELASSDLRWNAVSVRILIEQTVWEAGSPGTEGGFRATQAVCKDTLFMRKLLELIDRKLNSIKANWKELHCMEALATILAQTCSLLQDQVLRDDAQQITLRIRNALVQWVGDLLSHLQELRDYGDVRQCQDRLCYACICCHTTFTIIKILRPWEVFPDAESVAVFVQCSIIIRDNLPTSLPVDMAHLRRRNERLALELLITLQDLVQSCPMGFNNAIGKIWSTAHIMPQWTFTDSKKLWIETSTIADKLHASQSVHYNLFDGTLLVNGRRLGRMPESITNHPTYRELFGSQVFKVVPSDIKGLSYQAAHPIQGYTVHFGPPEEDLIVRALRSSEHLELVDRKYLRSEFPHTLITNFVHWLDLDRSQVYFQPRESPWKSSKSQWQITCTPSSFVTRLGHRFLLNYNRPVARYVVSVFEALDCREHILISRPQGGLVEIELTRLRLHFFVRRDRRIECRELQALVDTNQDLGTLVGLQSRLVFCGVNQQTGNFSRRVIIPFGNVDVTRAGEHVKVLVSTPGQASVPYVTLAVDDTLKCLRSPVDPRARLFKILVQALCSGILADPLTSCTGAEESLNCLQEAAMFQCRPLTEESLDILQSIARISPKRKFYPEHLQVMENTTWRNDLPTPVQKDEFALAVREVLDYNNKFRAFHGRGDIMTLRNESRTSLSQRALCQRASASSQPSSLSMTGSKKDRVFGARDRTTTADLSYQSETAFEIATLLQTWGEGNSVMENLYDQFRQWQTISGFGQSFHLLDLNELFTIQIKQHWGALYNICCASTGRQNRWRLSFLFGIFAFSQPTLLPHLRTLLEFAFRPVDPGFSNVPNGEYQVHHGHGPGAYEIRSIVSGYRVQFRNINWNESRGSYTQLRDSHEENTRQHFESLVTFAIQLWPCSDLASPSFIDPSLVHVGFLDVLRPLFKTWYRNLQLYKAASSVRHVFESRFKGNAGKRTGASLPDFLSLEPDHEIHHNHQPWDLFDLMKLRPCPSLLGMVSAPGVRVQVQRSMKREKFGELDSLIDTQAQRGGKVRQTYAHGLKNSLEALKALAEKNTSEDFASTAELKSDRCRHKQAVDSMINSITDALSPRNEVETVLFLTGLWPQMNIRTLLSNISPKNGDVIEKSWRSGIIDLGTMITVHQRASRLLGYAEMRNKVSYWKELANDGFHGWSPEEYPEWLLMQIEHNFLIRKIQVDVAKHMITPKNNKSAVMQLNMGEGKSSVIIPMVAAVLANGRFLVRIAVLKPLFAQMNEVLSDRLGGIVGRRIVSVPFNRQTPLSSNVLNELKAMHQSWKDRGDIFLVQPEHVLSFKLMALDRLYNGHLPLANQMLDLHSWSGNYCRDLLDESDELLSPNFELVYTIGSQRLVSGQPDRWTLVQRILSLVEKNVQDIYKRHPLGVEVNSNILGAFPSIRVLDKAADFDLMARICRDVGNGFVPEISLEHCSADTKKAVLKFIGNRELSADVQRTVLEAYRESITLDKLLVLRGLVGYGIVFFALHRKRWTVNYGLDRRRCLMAVPYRAKGVPSASAEFGHPDCAIVLTCLSFYYEGLTEQQLLQSFHLLFAMTDPTVEYEQWQRPLRLPLKLQSVKGVNLDDSKQWNDIILPEFRRSKATVDFFLTNVVFPREAKEFDFKLSTSGWDLASDGKLATGFSGTNDLWSLNPLSIRQRDIPELLETSALVLENLLKSENRQVILGKGEHGKMMDVSSLIKLVARHSYKVQVIIDVGAQVLELTNREVIQLWLEVDQKAVAGVYFDESDTPMVLDRSGISERLLISGYHGNLNDCVVFLDEAHTRGIDLDLPSNFRAMVTLGPNITKDRFVQGVFAFTAHYLELTDSSLHENAKTGLWTIHRHFRSARNLDVNSEVARQNW